MAASGITQERAARVLANEPAGAYRRLVLAAPRIASLARPGQFVACAVGPADGSGGLLLRRAFSLHGADPQAGTIEVVVADHAPGTHWVTTRQPGDPIDVVGPAGNGFPLPAAHRADGNGADGAAGLDGAAGADGVDGAEGPAGAQPGQVGTVLVGGGYGSAPLFWLASVLRAGGIRADLVLGAASADRLFLPAAYWVDGPPVGPVSPAPGSPADQRRGRPNLGSLHLVTEDGSAGHTGLVTDLIPGVVAAQRAAGWETGPVYGCGPMAMLRAVHRVARSLDAPCGLAVEESMACGIGVCMTCVLPVVDREGTTRMTRSCIEGPVFDGDRLRWDAIEISSGRVASRVPDDCYGAPLPREGGH